MILLTGFEPFDERGYNSSAEVLELLPEAVGEHKLVTRILPVDWNATGPTLDGVIRDLRPHIAIGLGMSCDPFLRLERIAVNFCGQLRLDCNGQPPAQELVSAVGPLAYRSTLPLVKIDNVLREAGHRSIISGSAGDYLCNLCFYRLMMCHSQGLVHSAGFVHVPPKLEHGGWDLSMLCAAIVLVLKTTLKERSTS